MTPSPNPRYNQRGSGLQSSHGEVAVWNVVNWPDVAERLSRTQGPIP
ncbi:Fe-Mn family superoxide dismutase [Aestuariimicrobium sp. p3-SID1156]|nr:Fe-Mn family superoxide dismutase [Aestuariimicrobium sp. p3-SID1156]MCT1460154.1 Fe-Mn family superoxide dismutase [Aestuariimicrobium sp. p3-SID1156]